MIEKGGILLIAPELRAMARDCTIGMSDAEVMERTGLTRSSWRRLWRGEVISDTLLLRFAVGLGRDPQPFLDAAKKVRPGVTPDQLLAYVLSLSPLSQDARIELMQVYRKLEQEAEAVSENKNAA